METKPTFCSECGAKLTGSGAFCPVCGAKQEFLSVAETPVVETAPVVATIAESVVVPVAVPENSLAAPKAKISVIGLILAIFALSVTFFAELTDLYILCTKSTFGVYFHEIFIKNLISYLQIPQIYVSMLTAWVLPIAAVVLVFWKKKPAALTGLIVTGVILLVQIVLAAYYPRYTATYGGKFPRLWFRAYQLFNGEHLFMNLKSFFHYRFSWRAAMTVAAQLNYFMKNVWVMLTCLFVAIQKHK